ncbi:MAG: prephenate dehydrogenase [Planctomycetota bacterium]
MIERVGVIGLGQFGRLLAESLAPHAEVVAHDARLIDAPPRGVALVGLDDVARSDVVVPAVNLQHLGEVLDAVGPVLGEGALVADVTSVKVEPIGLMNDRLPNHAQILGTHPLFGPQSVAEKGLAGQRLAVCRVRIDDAVYAAVERVLSGALGLDVIETTADEHDRQMALVQALTHLVGHAAAELDLADLPLGTLAYRRLRQLAQNISGDSEELFDAIQGRNPYAAGVRARFVEAVDRVRRRAGD